MAQVFGQEGTPGSIRISNDGRTFRTSEDGIETEITSSFGSTTSSSATRGTRPSAFHIADEAGTGIWSSVTSSWSSAEPIIIGDLENEIIIDNIKNETTNMTMKEMPSVLEKVYANDSLRRSVVPLFIGNPGLGKTVLIQEFAKKKKAKLVELITSQMSPFEISGIAMPDKESKKMTYFNFDKLEQLKDGDILFFDELLNGNPVVLNACLTILEQRKFISGQPLPNIMIIAAANPQGMSPLTPQIKERFVWYDVSYNEEMWGEYMMDKYGLTKTISTKLSHLIKNEEFETNNFFTPRSVDKAVNMLINEVSTPYEHSVKPLLEHMIKNPFSEEVQLPTRMLAPGEMISWLELIKLKMQAA